MLHSLLLILLNFLRLQSFMQGQMRTKGVQSVVRVCVWRQCTKRKHYLIAPIILITLILPIFFTKCMLYRIAPIILMTPTTPIFSAKHK